MVPITTRVPLPKSAHRAANLQPPRNPSWERLRDRPTYKTEDSQFTLTFRVKTDPKFVTFVAFSYPYSYRELQTYLSRLEKKHSTAALSYDTLTSKPESSIFFHRECVCKSIEDRRVDLLTLSSTEGISAEREERLDRLFPCES